MRTDAGSRGGLKIPDDSVIAWLSANVLPHEADVRAWLRRSGLSVLDPDDLIQEAYARIAASPGCTQVQNGRAYFFATVRNLALEHFRRARIVRVDAMAEIERLRIEDDAPSTERVAFGRIELARVSKLIEELPNRCRQVFVLRKVHALPQKEVARRLGISENTVEKQMVKGLRLLLDRLARGEAGGNSPDLAGTHERQKVRRRDRTRGG
ncbi:MAG: RNA polymerase sigma factor [Hyphomonadaceae bacterium]